MGGFTFNPVLSEIHAHMAAMSPAAQAAVKMANPSLPAPDPTMTAKPQLQPGMLLPPSGGAPPPDIAMPSNQAPISMPKPTPTLVTGPNRGQAMMSDGTSAPLGTTAGDTAERSRLLSQGSGISQIAGKIENTRLGQAHPFLGKLLGGLAQGAATVGDIGLSVAAPGVAAMVPGTEIHHEALLNQANRALTGDVANEQKQSQSALENATAQHTAAETPEIAPNAESARALQGAQTRRITDEASDLENQRPTYSIHDTEEGPLFVNNQTGSAQHLSVDGTPVGPKIKLTQSQPIIGHDGKPHTYMLDEKGNKVVDLGVHYERPNVTNINAGEKTWEYANNQLNTLGKPISDLTMRMGRLQDTLAQGTPQADALVAPELMTVMAGGQGSGLRMNEAEISRIVGGRSNWQSLQAAMNKWSVDPAAANSITPAQREQIHALVNTVNAKLTAKQNIINDAANQMVDVSDATQQHRILAETRQKLQAIDEGNGGNVAPNSSGGLTPAQQRVLDLIGGKK